MPPSHRASSDTPGTTSVTLLKRAMRGEEAAWRRLVGIYSPLIYARCRTVGLTSGDAGDVVQEVFSSVFLALPKFRRERPQDGFRRWLRTIARNAAVDVMRRRRRETLAEGGAEGQARLEQIADPFADESAFSDKDPGVSLVVHQALELFRADYEERSWQAFWRTTVEDQPSTDVARELGLSPGAVRQAKYRILVRLREEFADLELSVFGEEPPP